MDVVFAKTCKNIYKRFLSKRANLKDAHIERLMRFLLF